MPKSDYRVAAGWNQPLGSLILVSPQPMSQGVQITGRTYLSGGTIVDEGLYCEWIWSALATAVAYRQLLAQFGFDSDTILIRHATKVTVYTRDQLYAYRRFNAYACLPLLGEEAGWKYRPVGVTMLLRDLTPI